MFVVGLSSMAPINIVVNGMSQRQRDIAIAFFNSGLCSDFVVPRPVFLKDGFEFKIPTGQGIPEAREYLARIDSLIKTIIKICEAADKASTD
jgi:hypothetical protein